MSYKRAIISALKAEYKRQTQGTMCFCPVCKNELCASNSFVEDKDLVRYKCSNCGSKSEWNFDIAPCPMIIRYQPIQETLIEYKSMPFVLSEQDILNAVDAANKEQKMVVDKNRISSLDE